MTHIPGTGKISKNDKAEINHKLENTTVVNVKEMHRKDWQKPQAEDTVWYNQLKYWLLFGSGLSFIFIVGAFINWRFLLVVPLGPIAAYSAWMIRRFSKKFEKIDVLK